MFFGIAAKTYANSLSSFFGEAKCVDLALIHVHEIFMAACFFDGVLDRKTG